MQRAQMAHQRLSLWAAAPLVMWCAPAPAETVPFSDTEDATLGDLTVADGRLHGIVRLNVRNGDYARGSYDDDASGLGRVPAHLEAGVVYDLHHDRAGGADAWIEFHSSNGLHAPQRGERAAARSWYESNNLIGIVMAPAAGLRAALSYTVKTSPNGVASTSHETSLALAYDGDKGLAALHPSAVATWRPKGGHGLYAQVGIEPQRDLTRGDDSPSLSLPLLVGIGVDSFYQPGSGSVAFGSAGLAYTRPLRLSFAQATIRAELVALIRERRLAQLDGPGANRHRVVPIGQVTLTFAR